MQKKLMNEQGMFQAITHQITDICNCALEMLLNGTDMPAAVRIPDILLCLHGMNISTDALALKAFDRRFPFGASMEKVGRPMFVCVSVCPSIFTPGARTAAPIGTDEYSFDAPEQRKDEVTRCGPIGCTGHVPRAISRTLAKINWPTLQAKPMDGSGSNLVGR